MAYELLDRAGLTKVVSEISTKVNAALSDTKPITLITSGTGSGTQKFFYNTTTNDLMANPNGVVKHIPYAVSGYTTNTVKYNVGTKFYDAPSYLSTTSEYEEALEYLAIGTRSGTGPYGTAIGSNAEAWNDYSVAVGTRAFCGASGLTNYLSTFGDLMPVAKEKFRRTGSTAVGALAQAGGACTSVGRSAYAWLDSGTAIGAASNAGGSYATSLGEETTAASTGSTALGSMAAASAQYATAIGYKAAVSADGYRANDQYVEITSSSVSLEPTDEENLSVALGAFSTVRPGQNDVVSVGSEMQDYVRNFFNGVTGTNGQKYSYAYDWNTETCEREPFYRRVVNVKDPIEDHDAATKGYVDKLAWVQPQKDDSGFYGRDAIHGWVSSFDEQRLLVKIQPQLGNRAWSLDTASYNSIFTEISALVGDTDLSSGHGVCFSRPCYIDDSGKITWIRGIDPEDGTQPNYVITPGLYGSVSYDGSTDAICDNKHGAITWLTIGNRYHDGDIEFHTPMCMPRYCVLPSDTDAIPASGAKYSEGVVNDNCTIPTEMLWYIQTMWLLKYSNTWAGQWMDIGVNQNGSMTTLQDPTQYGGEYGEYQDCLYLSWSTKYLYKQFPEGYKLNIYNTTKGTQLQTEVLFSTAYDDDSGILCVYVQDYFTYEEGDVVKFSFVSPADRTTGETDGWLNDGWKDASAFSGQFRQRASQGGSAMSAPISAETAVSAYRLCDIELGMGGVFKLGQLSLTQPDTSSWDYLEWSLTTTAEGATFKFPFDNLSGSTAVPSQACYLSNALYLSRSSGNYLWGPARFASEYSMVSYSGVMGLPYITQLDTINNVYISWSNESVLVDDASSIPRPSFFYYTPYTNTASSWGTKYPPVVKHRPE